MTNQNPLMTPLGLSLIAILMILIVLAAELPALVSSTGNAIFSSVPDTDSNKMLLDQHKQAMATDRDRFNGRSFFFMPPAPPKPKPKVEEKPKTAPPPPPPPPKVDRTPPKPTYPKNYTGPNLEAIVGPTAFFRPSSGKLIIVNVGETNQDIELLGTNPPRSIEVKYKKGGPYTVKLFEMAEPEFLNKEIDDIAAEKDIVLDTRDPDAIEPELGASSGWPAGTIAGDEVRVRYRQGPYEGSITGVLKRANQTWLVLQQPGRDEPVEIFKADVVSVQNLTPVPPEPEPEPEPEPVTSAPSNENVTDALNANSTGMEMDHDSGLMNSNASRSVGNSNNTGIATGQTDAVPLDDANSNASEEPENDPASTKDG